LKDLGKSRYSALKYAVARNDGRFFSPLSIVGSDSLASEGRQGSFHTWKIDQFQAVIPADCMPLL
jgi:hypothetical protein